MGVPSVSDVLSIPTRFGGVTNGANSIANYLAQQQQAKQGLQLQQAQTLSNYQNMLLAYTGQRNPNIDAVLAQNPYGRVMVPQGGGQPSQGQPQMGTQPQPAMGGQASPQMGGGNMPQQGGGMPMPGGMTSGANFNPLGSMGGQSPVVTGQSQTFAPMGDMGPKTTTSMGNPQGEAQVQSAKDYAGDMSKAQAQANIGAVRDTNQLRTMAQSLSNLNDLHKQLSDEGFAGNIYAEGRADSAKFLPKSLGIQQAVVPDAEQDKIGRFVAARNESLIKSQPILTQQYGQAGSVRIMDSVLDLAKGELGDLSTPHAQFEGQAKGSLATLYRINLGSQKYAQDLAQNGQQWPSDPDEAAQGIYKSMPELSEAQQNQLDQLTNSTIGAKKMGGASGNFNPVSNAKPQQQQSQGQGKQLNANMAMQLLQAAGGDKNKARQMAKQQGYQF